MKEFRLSICKFLFFAFAVLMIASCAEKKKFNGYLYPIRENGLYGYIDSVGNKIIEPKFLWASTFHNGLAIAVIDTIYQEVSDFMAYEVGERDTIINVYRMYAKYGYINKSGKFVIAPRFVSYVNMAKIGDVTNDMDACSNALYRHSFRNGRAMFCDTTTWKDGYIDTKGNVVITAKYYYSKPFCEGLAVVRDVVAEPLFLKDWCITASKLRCAYIDTTGNAVTDFKFEKLSQFNGRCGIGSYKEVFNVSSEENGSYTKHNYIIDREGNLGKDLGFWDEFYGFTRDGISLTRQVVFLQVYDGMPDSYSFIGEDGNYLKPLKGLTEYQLDSLGRCDDIMQVLPEDVDIVDATYFNNGFAGISPDGNRWFIIDKYLIIHGYGEESIFEGFQAFNNGLAAVKKNGKWGFINKKIMEQIPCKYDSCGIAYPYLEEVFEYDIQGGIKKKAYINRKDSLVWESPLYKLEKIENQYSIKDSKDYGKWTYEYNPLNKYLSYLIIGVVVLLIAICIIWNSVSHKSLKGENLEEIVIQNEPENEVVVDDNLSNVNGDDIDEILAYPTVGQYAEVIKDSAKAPGEYFDKLKHLCPVLDSNGEPIMSSGNFAVVFKMKDEYGKQYAVRCFHRVQKGREKNYMLICEELAKVSSPYLSPIKYYDKELLVESGEYPVLLMDWVEGMTLDNYIRKFIDDKKALSQLTANFKNLAIWLLNQPFAHGDLKPDNILVKNDGSLVLVDYDGMFIPAMKGQKAKEIGSPDFRNPSRTEYDFNKDVDTFPIISILLSLELLVENKEYLSQYGAEDRLLFSEKDYRNIEDSRLYRIAFVSYKDDIVELAKLMKDQIMGMSIDCETLISTIKNDIWRNNLYANDRIEKPLRITYILYTIAFFVIPFLMKSAGWGVLEISFVMLISNLILYVIVNIADLLRPSKKYHIDIGDMAGFGIIDAFVPVVLMISPSYEGEWYITLLIWILWCCNSMITVFMGHPYELRLRYFMTSQERIIEQERIDKVKIRSELRKEEEQQQKRLKEIEEEELRQKKLKEERRLKILKRINYDNNRI